jgi:hypothetical protein
VSLIGLDGLVVNSDLGLEVLGPARDLGDNGVLALLQSINHTLEVACLCSLLGGQVYTTCQSPGVGLNRSDSLAKLNTLLTLGRPSGCGGSSLFRRNLCNLFLYRGIGSVNICGMPAS